MICLDALDSPLGLGYLAVSHSLAMDAGWAGLFAGAWFLWRRHRREAWVLFAAVLSHWLLDFVSNRDMPVAPGMRLSAGWQLWASLPATVMVEGGLWLLALILYARDARPKPMGDLRILDRGRAAPREMVCQHRRSASTRATDGRHRWIRVLCPGSGMGRVDGPVPG